MKSPGQGRDQARVLTGGWARGGSAAGRPPSSHRRGAGCGAGAQLRCCRTRAGTKSQEVTRGRGQVALRDPRHERGSGEG